MKIRCPTQFLETLKKMRARDDSIIFDSIHGDLQLIVRPDPNAPPCTMVFELAIYYDDDKDKDKTLFSALNNDTGYFYEDGDYILCDVDIPSTATPDSPEVAGCIEKVHWFYGLRLCGCSKYLIKHAEDDVCMYCQLTTTTEDMEKDTCCICHIDSARVSMPPLECCGHHVHAACLRRWHAKNAEKTCPLCRRVATS